VPTNDIPANKIDGYRTFIHELGHSHSLGHIIDDSKVMYGFSPLAPTAPQRTVKLSQDQSAEQGGQFIANSSFNLSFPLGCSVVYNMTPLIPQNCTEFDFSAINDKQKSENFKVKPIPFNDYIDIDLPENITEYSIQIYNSVGALIYQNLSSVNFKINTQQFSNGIYLVKVSALNFNESKLIVK
jgi:hypothetical protein